MNKINIKYLLIITVFLSILFPIVSSSSTSIGMSETMGYHGGFNLNLNINDHFFITTGSSLIFGGIGLGCKYSFNESRISPFISSAVFGSYMIPLLCENCKGLKYDRVITGALGLDVFAIKIRKQSIHLQIGIMSYVYSTGNTPTESPIDNPFRWPFINIKMVVDR